MMYDVTVMKKVELIEEIINLKEKILSKIAHEFKTPLICVIALSEEIQNDLKCRINLKEDLSIKKKIGHVMDFCNYTLLLINDIAQYLYKKPLPIDSGYNKIIPKTGQNKNFESPRQQRKVSINYEEVNVIEVLEFCFRILKTLLTYNKNKIELIKPQMNFDKRLEGLKIKSDPTRLKQIILNLISNAVKFTQIGNITLNAKLEDINLLIEVNDTGAGIKPEDLQNVFIDFKMLDDHLNMNSLGSGLGLSISKNFAEQMGYHLRVHSQPAIGSTFYLVINLEDYFKTPLLNDKIILRKYNSSTNVNIALACDENKENRKELIQNKNRNRNKKNYHSTKAVIKKEMTIDNLDLFFKKNILQKSILDKISSSLIKKSEVISETNEINLVNEFPKIINLNSLNIESLSNSGDDSDKTIRKSPQLNNVNLRKFIQEHRHKSESTINQFSKQRNINMNLIIDDSTCNKILIVDDNTLILNQLETMIKRVLKENDVKDYKIIKGLDGIDMLKYIVDDQKNKNSIKCAFVDENMEYMNGSEAIRIMKNLEKCNRIKPIYIVKFSSEEYETVKMNNKGDDILSINKPATKAQLNNILNIVGILK